MKILQTPISDNHKSAMFFNGVVAEDKGYKLATYMDGEIMLNGKYLIGKEIIEVAKSGIIDDETIEEYPVDIHVDKFICIYNGDVCDENLIDDGQLYFDNYDEAIEGFKEFLSEL
jgi:hypothetical protein